MKYQKIILNFLLLVLVLVLTNTSCIPSVKKDTKEEQTTEVQIKEPESAKQDTTIAEKEDFFIGGEMDIEPKQVYDFVEKMPSFPGGQEDMMKFIATNLKYPEETKNSGIQGRVVVRFVVPKSGAIQDIQVVRGIDSALDKEVVRVVKAMPKWEPGMQNGKPVAVYFTLPIFITPPKN